MWALPVVFLAAIVLLIWLRPRMRSIPEDERSIVLRWGRLNRIAGPGLDLFLAGIETERGRFVCRNEPHQFWLDQVFSYDIPVALSLDLWSRFDPRLAAGGNIQALKDMTLLSDEQRQAQMTAKVRRAVSEEFGAYQVQNPVAQDASNLAKLAHVIPGSPLCSNLLRRVAVRLAPELRTIGVFYDTRQPIILTHIDVPPDLEGTFTRQRTVPQLRALFPNLPEDVLLQMTAHLQGVAAPTVVQRKEITLAAPAGTSAAHNYVLDDDAIVDLRGPQNSTPAPPRQGNATKPGAAEASERLSHDDLGVLRPFPRK